MERIFMTVPQGILPALFAATSADATPGGYYGPNGFYESRGIPADALVPKAARSEVDSARLWDLSEKMTGVRFQ